MFVISVLCLLCFRAHLFIDTVWSPAGKGLTSWLSFVMSNCVFVTFPCGILGQVWNLVVSIPDRCPLSYFDEKVGARCFGCCQAQQGLPV